MMKRKKEIVLFLIVIFAVIVAVSYSFISSSIEGEDLKISAETVNAEKLEFIGDDLYFLADLEESKTYGASVSNPDSTNSGRLKYSLKLVVEENTFTSTSSENKDLTVQFDDTDNNIESMLLKMPAAGEYIVAENVVIDVGETHNYNTIVSFNETGEEQNINYGAQFKAHLVIYDCKLAE